MICAIQRGDFSLQKGYQSHSGPGSCLLVGEWEGQAVDKEEIFANHIPDKGLGSIIYKEHFQNPMIRKHKKPQRK